MILKAYEAYNGLNQEPFKSYWARSGSEAIAVLGSAYTNNVALYRTAWFCKINKTVYSLKPRLIRPGYLKIN